MTRAKGDVWSRTGRATSCGQLGVIDPNCRAIALHMYEGLVKIIPIDANSGALSDTFDIR